MFMFSAQQDAFLIRKKMISNYKADSSLVSVRKSFVLSLK